MYNYSCQEGDTSDLVIKTRCIKRSYKMENAKRKFGDLCFKRFDNWSLSHLAEDILDRCDEYAGDVKSIGAYDYIYEEAASTVNYEDQRWLIIQNYFTTSDRDINFLKAFQLFIDELLDIYEEANKESC